MTAVNALNAMQSMVRWRTPTVQFDDPFQVLIATVLSARTRDANTEKASRQLFARFPTPQTLGRARVRTIERLIKPAGFYRVKARHVKALSLQLMHDFQGVVPDSKELLMSLKGVGSKTAGCVLVYAFKKPAIPVDVHVHRVFNRLGILDTRFPEDTEGALESLVPRKRWLEVNHLSVLFGQTICLPRNPKCKECMLSAQCPHVISRTQ
ncbi:MAG: endonuclease III [Candidatus Diapherotrites archaeon]|nr:endonuclease III [Candidatus Diapherotrites archaeon]